jgi:hypothetical protein
MKNVLILTEQDVSYYRRDRDFGGSGSSRDIQKADIVISQVEHNEDYFFVVKNRDTPTNGFYIHRVQVADFILGHSVTLYNREQTFRNDKHEWDTSMKELDGQMDEILEEIQKDEIKKNTNPLNALHRMELDD